MRIAKFIPGFRSNKLLKKIIASLYYCFCLIGFLVSIDNPSNLFVYFNWLILPFVIFNLYGLIKKQTRWYIFVIPLALIIFSSFLSQHIESNTGAEVSVIPTIVVVVVLTVFVVVTVRLIRDSKSKDDIAFTKAIPEESTMNTFVEIQQFGELKTSSYEKEKIAPRKQQNPHKVFTEMRTIGRTSNNYYGYTDSATTFVQQAKFMADFTDDCEGFVPLDAYYTTYAQMNDAQLRTYFTWRTKVRNGQIGDTSLSYAFCYIYELLNNINIVNANDGIEKLLMFWTGFRLYNVKIDSYLTEWIKDYFVVNCFTNDFDLIASRFPVPYKTKRELFDKLNHGTWDINFVEINSRHKITRMSFYKNGNQKVIEECLNAVFTALNDLFKANGIDLINLYVSVSPNGYYTPFRGAVYEHGKHRDKTVKLSDYETYNCKNGKWTVHEYNYTYFQITKGYILKTIEIEIRKALGGKKSLSPPKIDEISIELRDGHRSWNQVKEWRKKAYELLKNKEFERTIQNAVQSFSKSANIIIKDGTVTEIKPVEIDLNKLDKIREEHEETARKLIIEECLEEETIDSTPEMEQAIPPEQTVDSFGFTGFIGLLNENEMSLIITLLKSGQTPSNCELLIESINEKSLMTIDDNIIGYTDSLPCLYEEYEDELRSSLGENL